MKLWSHYYVLLEVAVERMASAIFLLFGVLSKYCCSNSSPQQYVLRDGTMLKMIIASILLPDVLLRYCCSTFSSMQYVLRDVLSREWLRPLFCCLVSYLCCHCSFQSSAVCFGRWCYAEDGQGLCSAVWCWRTWNWNRYSLFNFLYCNKIEIHRNRCRWKAIQHLSV